MREGKCNRCGACCREMGWLDITRDDRVLEWLAARVDGKLQLMDHREDAGIVWINLKHTCEQLIEHPDGTCSCRIEATKPALCRAFPEGPEGIPAGCGFRFAEGGEAMRLTILDIRRAAARKDARAALCCDPYYGWQDIYAAERRRRGKGCRRRR